MRAWNPIAGIPVARRKRTWPQSDTCLAVVPLSDTARGRRARRVGRLSAICDFGHFYAYTTHRYVANMREIFHLLVQGLMGTPREKLC